MEGEPNIKDQFEQERIPSRKYVGIVTSQYRESLIGCVSFLYFDGMFPFHLHQEKNYLEQNHGKKLQK